MLILSLLIEICKPKVYNLFFGHFFLTLFDKL